MDIKFTQQEEDFRQEIRDFLQETLPEDWNPLGQTGKSAEEQHSFTRRMTGVLADKGWLTLAWPEEYGGQGRSIMEQVIYNEEMSYKNVPGTELGTGAISWVGPVLMIAGTEEQKSEHLPPIARGERLWCTLYSEPGSGSDLASLQTLATRDGDDYVINGQKIWTSSAHVADWGWLAARTNPDAPKHRGISIFMLDMKSPGVTVRPIENMAGGRDFNEVYFDDVRVPSGNLVGQEDRGWYTLAVALDFERSGVGYSAGARRTLDALVKYVKQTERNGEPLSKNQNVRRKLAQRFTETEVSRWLSYKVAWMQSQGMVPNAEASMSKMYGTELTQRVARTGMEILGMAGQISQGSKWSPLEGHIQQLYLSSVSSTIAAGTSEIQRNIVAQRGLGLPR
ncbi:MAG: acyl-CoA dehydrogenase family protein [Dehalococcoidia bacterium]|nr:acyl-CoA dehydrogenase family protein [Dehalococcoidia bacterium]